MLGADPQGIPFGRISVERGLPQATVNSILQDREGFLWFGTQEGLARYDGQDFRVYKHDPTDRTSLPASWILALEEGPSGEIWIGTQGGGLARWSREHDTFERYRHDAGDAVSLPGNAIRDLHLDSRGALWVATFRSGIGRLDADSGVFERFQYDPADPRSLADNRTRAIYEDRAGRVWVATLGGLERLDDSGFAHFRHDPDDPRSLSDDRVYAVLETTDGSLWAGTEGGLNRQRADGGGFERFRHDPEDPTSLANDWVTALLEDASGRLWIATDGGLSLWRDGHFDNYRHDAEDPLSLAHDRLLALSQDSGGVLWVGTQGGGANKWHPRTWDFAHYRSGSGDGLSSDAVFAFAETPDDRLVIGTFGGGLDVLDRSTGRFEHFRHDPADAESLPGDQVTALHQSPDGRLWVGTLGRGLGLMEADSPGRFGRFRHEPSEASSLSDDDIVTITEDRQGIVWLSTHGGGLNRFDADTESFTAFRHDPERPESLADDHLNALAFDGEDGLWIGTLGAGVDRLDPARTGFRHFRHDLDRPESLASDTVFSLHLDSAGTLWIGHSAGLDRLDGAANAGESPRFRHYFERDGLPNSSVWGIRSDGEGQIWLSTNGGLARLDPGSGTFKSFDVSHGLQSNEFNLGAHFKSRDGTLFFGGINGFNAFDPTRIRSNAHVPPVVITSFAMSGEPPRFDRGFLDGGQVALGWRDYYFDVEFAALDFTAPERNRYRYKLEGFDQQWVELGGRRRATFTNLDAGDYTLRLQGSNNDGMWNEAGASLRISVAPPPWATWWAYSIYALMLAAAVGGYTRWQNARLERERRVSARLRQVDRMRDEFLANTSHELRTPLYGIGGLAEHLLDDPYVERSVSAKRHLETIVASSRRLSSLVNDILDFSELRRGDLELDRQAVDLHSMVDVVLTLTGPLVGEKSIELRNEVPPDLPPAHADEDRLQQILHNLLGNAVKFTEAGHVTVKARLEDSDLRVDVVDTGIGIAANHRKRIFGAFEQADASTERRFGGTGLGLAVTRQLVERHGGRIGVQSTEGAGSTFSFTLPVSSREKGVKRGGVPLLAEPSDEVSDFVAAEEAWLAQSEAAATGEAGRGADATVLTSGTRLLIADDEPVNRLVLYSHLRDAGYEVAQAADGPEALALIDEQKFDLVLLDIMMPGMSGYEVCRRMREQHKRHELPIVFLTAKTQLSDRLAGFAEGANDYLVKPVAKGELLARVETQLELLWVHRHFAELVSERTEEVQELRDLLPICAECKRVRDDEGYWSQIEVYLQKYSGTKITHGLCPGCAGRMLSMLEADMEAPDGGKLGG